MGTVRPFYRSASIYPTDWVGPQLFPVSGSGCSASVASSRVWATRASSSRDAPLRSVPARSRPGYVCPASLARVSSCACHSNLLPSKLRRYAGAHCHHCIFLVYLGFPIFVKIVPAARLVAQFLPAWIVEVPVQATIRRHPEHLRSAAAHHGTLRLPHSVSCVFPTRTASRSSMTFTISFPFP